MLDSYLCPKCKGLIPEIPNALLSFCVNCGDKYSLKPFQKINDEAQKYLEGMYQFCSCFVYVTIFGFFSLFLDDDVNQLELLIKSLKIREKILYKHHKDFEEVYYRIYSYYVESGMFFFLSDIAKLIC